jgi:hypothetical protein
VDITAVVASITSRPNQIKKLALSNIVEVVVKA